MESSSALASLMPFNDIAARSLLTGSILARDLIAAYPRQLRACRIRTCHLWKEPHDDTAVESILSLNDKYTQGISAYFLVK